MSYRKYALLPAVITSFLALSCTTIFAQQKLFTQLDAKQTGVTFINAISESEGLNVLAYEYFFNGAGLAVGDLDNDGLPDLFFTANMGPNKVYRNLGGLRFQDVTKSAGARVEGRAGHWKTGVTMADVNNDGLLDVYVCYSGKGEPDVRRNQLFINQGNFTFREAGKEFGLDDPSYSTQAAFFDYDRDGDLDMFLLNHSVKKVDNLEFAKFRNTPDTFAGCRMFENNGSRFIDVSDRCGISRSALTFGLGIVVADINQDGWPDLYATNDYNEPDHLYLNNRDKTFRDMADSALTHMSQFSMGADIADFNNDGLPDIITLDMLPEGNKRQKLLQLQENYDIFELMQQQGLHKQYMRNMLHLNNGNGTFSEIGQLAGVFKTDWSWTPLMADFDNDGYKDLFITNGYLRDYTNKDFLRYWGDYKVKKAMDREPVQLMDLVRAMPSTKLPNYMFRNNRNLTFSNEQVDWGFEQPAISSAAVYADLDNDGDLDIIVNNINDPAFIHRNNARALNRHHYISFRVVNEKAAPAIGARIYLYAGGVMQYAELGQNRGYLSAVSTIVHFGLEKTGQVDSVRIIWPDGGVIMLTAPPADQMLTITPLQKRVSSPSFATPVPPVFIQTVSPVDYQHEGFGENDFKRQQLLLFMYSNTGPVMAKSDVNRDGLEDLFVSGNRTQPGRLYLQSRSGAFSMADGLSIVNEEEASVSAALFTDVNGDGWPDLYVAKGGYSIWEPNTPSLQDELYINDGKGGLRKSLIPLPDVSASAKSCIRAADVDADGDIDIFVGGRLIPGRYPLTPESYLLINDGTGRFTKKPAAFSFAGMVTDAQWHDMNGDNRPDLVMVGEFMPISVYLNLPIGFEDVTETYFSKPLKGMWSSLRVRDLDGDGKADIIAGNIGRNLPFRVTDQEPAALVYADFDGNGSVDPFFCFHIQGKMYPYVSRDELNEQIYAMRKKFTSYEQYSTAVLEDIFTPDEWKKAVRLDMNEQETVVLLQRDGKFNNRTELPVQAQFANVSQIFDADINADGITDLLLLGNSTPNRLKMGAIQANEGALFLGRGGGRFEYIPQAASGLKVQGDVKSMEAITVGGRRMILAGASDKKIQAYAY